MSRSCGLLCGLVLALAAVPEAEAHHFKGLPHFSYFENYPQTPQEEFLGQEGPYEFSLVLYDFQGLERRDVYQPEDVQLFLIVFDLLHNQVYNGPVRLEILDRGEPLLALRQEGPAQENTYQFDRALPPEGRYALRVTLLDAGGLSALIPFRLSSQQVHWGRWIAAGLAGLIIVGAAGARRARIVRDRRRSR